MNVPKLKGRMVEKGLNVEALAGLINVDRSTLYRKLSNAEKITIGDAKKISSALALTPEEATAIFFN